MVVDHSYDRVDRLYKLLNSFESTEARNATSQVSPLRFEGWIFNSGIVRNILFTLKFIF